eukprot:scaffold147612_cov39-Prasinocladus_malaysianus.AAC.2
MSGLPVNLTRPVSEISGLVLQSSFPSMPQAQQEAWEYTAEQSLAEASFGCMHNFCDAQRKLGQRLSSGSSSESSSFSVKVAAHNHLKGFGFYAMNYQCNTIRCRAWNACIQHIMQKKSFISRRTRLNSHDLRWFTVRNNV